MKFLFEMFIVILALALVFGLVYSVLTPMLEGLGIELDNIFKLSSDDTSNDTTKTDETTNIDETTSSVKCKHEYDADAWSWLDENKHYNLCTLCGEDGKIISVHTYGTDGICSGCYTVKPDSGSTDAHECVLTKLSSVTTEGYHIYVCSDSSCTLAKKKQEEHNYSDVKWETVKEATCTTKGQEKRACSVCKRVTYRDIPAGHVWANGICSRCGLICKHEYGSDGICLFCGLYNVGEDPEMRCQHLNAWTNSGDQTGCYAYSYDLYCPDCGYYENRQDYELHDYVDTLRECISISSTQHSEVWVYTCSVCSKEQGGSGTSNIVDHTFESGVCIYCGYERSSDSSEVCSHINTIPTGDSYTCYEVAYDYCTDCNTELYHMYTYHHPDDNVDDICDECGTSLS